MRRRESLKRGCASSWGRMLILMWIGRVSSIAFIWSSSFFDLRICVYLIVPYTIVLCRVGPIRLTSFLGFGKGREGSGVHTETLVLHNMLS